MAFLLEATEIGFAEDEYSVSLGAGSWAEEEPRYVTVQLALKEDEPELEGKLYIEINDQIRGGYFNAKFEELSTEKIVISVPDGNDLLGVTRIEVDCSPAVFDPDPIMAAFKDFI